MSDEYRPSTRLVQNDVLLCWMGIVLPVQLTLVALFEEVLDSSIRALPDSDSLTNHTFSSCHSRPIDSDSIPRNPPRRCNDGRHCSREDRRNSHRHRAYIRLCRWRTTPLASVLRWRSSMFVFPRLRRRRRGVSRNAHAKRCHNHAIGQRRDNLRDRAKVQADPRMCR